MRRWPAIILMVLATRLLLVSCGPGAFIPPATTPPFDDSWIRSGSNPIIEAAEDWEETAVFEPCVLYDGTTWRMWYGGGWAHPALGYATSSDGIAWTKHGGNPVYGQGGSGYAYTSASAEVVKIGDMFWLFTSGGTSTTDIRSTFRVATSSDGIAWTTQSSSITLPAGTTMWGNRIVWQESGAWKMLQEAGPSPWHIYLYTSSDGLTWSIGNSGNPLSTLEVTLGAGGPTFATNINGQTTPKFGGLYHLWYQASPSGGDLPSHLYHATSPDLITWTQTSPNPILTCAGSGFEIDQVADAAIVVADGMAYLYYDGDDNPNETAKIGVATAPATH